MFLRENVSDFLKYTQFGGECQNELFRKKQNFLDFFETSENRLFLIGGKNWGVKNGLLF